MEVVMRAALFAFTGVAILAFWVGSRDVLAGTASMQEWPAVLSFSAVLLLLAVAVMAFGRLAGRTGGARLATLAAAGFVLASAANVFEDGFRIESFFFVFVTGLLLANVGLLGLAIATLASRRPRAPFLALVPALALAGILFFPVAGGPLMLAAWLVAAVAAWKRPVVEPAGAPSPAGPTGA
jgi:hypothetical protein